MDFAISAAMLACRTVPSLGISRIPGLTNRRAIVIAFASSRSDALDDSGRPARDDSDAEGDDEPDVEPDTRNDRWWDEFGADFDDDEPDPEPGDFWPEPDDDTRALGEKVHHCDVLVTQGVSRSFSKSEDYRTDR
jgi:hypothetical protein